MPVGYAGAPDRSAATTPPLRAGLRGSHPGSFEAAHARTAGAAFGPVRDAGEEPYDLVVVGAGVSGLAAAQFFREQRPGARVLVLDNHDDFGGHARRNEFRVGDRTLLGYGGSQSLEAPGAYSDVARGLIERLGADIDGLDRAYHHGFWTRHGLAPAWFFDRATYGVDRVVPFDFDTSLFFPLARAPLDPEESLARMPISPAARAELAGLLLDREDRLPESLWGEPALLARISYRDFLGRVGVSEPEVFDLLHHVPASYFGIGIDAIPADQALGFGLPGLGRTSWGRFEGGLRRALGWLVEPYTYHFPDGNASIARLLVRSLVPDVGGEPTMESLVTTDFDYGRLDRSENEVRVRLGQTVVRVAHDGPADRAGSVDVVYVDSAGAPGATRVRARHVVLACWGAMVPHICPELPATQRQALAAQVKSPLVYTNVVLRNWRALESLGLGLAFCPGSWHKLVMLDFPVSLGDYGFARSPDDPVVLHMQRVPVSPGKRPEEQFREGRVELLGTPFEAIEHSIRTQLGGMLGGAGFDPARDILAITVNRWPHGYAWRPNPLFDPEYAPGEAPYEVGRARRGRISIANSDAGGRAYLDEAIDQAWRAVGEQVGPT
jgi:spermidine dehydrogenase